MALVSVLALALAPTAADATTPILEFLVPGNSFPVSFSAGGGGMTAALAGFDTVIVCSGSRGTGAITGPRTALSAYIFTGCGTAGGTEGGERCRSAGAEEEEIRTQTTEAELVWIDQSRSEIALLLDPSGGPYMSFECGGEAIAASGPFLSPFGPVNQEASSFPTVLGRSEATQTPDEYEAAPGQRRTAIPTARRGTHEPGTIGVAFAATIQTSAAITIKARNVFEVSAQEMASELAAKAEAERQAAREAAAAKEMQEREAAETAESRSQEEEQARAARLRRRRLLSKALRRCRAAGPRDQRVACEKRAKKRYGLAPRAGAPSA